MSTSSIPREPLRDAKKPERMNEARPLPPEIAGAVNLLAHPLAGAAAVSALGFGLASHAFGVWMGAMTSAADMSERLFSSMEGARSDARSFGRRPGLAEQRAASTAKALIADAHSAASGPDNAAAKASGDAPALAVVPPDGKGDEAAAPAKAGIQPQAAARPAAPDDLKAISGIGPKLEKVLNDLGIWTYSQIAGWEKAEIAWMNGHLSFNGRIERDDWIAQARTLAASAGRH